MARILGYIASSLDGFIATGDDKLDWLFQYNDMDLGEHDYTSFLKRMRTLVMGRGTYDFIADDPTPWGSRRPQGLCRARSRARSIGRKGKLEVRRDVDRRAYRRAAGASTMATYGCWEAGSCKWPSWKRAPSTRSRSTSFPSCWAVAARYFPRQAIAPVQR